MFENIFLRKKAVPDKLTAYGFRQENELLRYITDILSGSFVLSITIDRKGTVETSLIEKENGEEYVLYKTNTVGSYVGEIRTAIEAVLSDIAEQCYEPSVFKTAQAQMIMEYVRETYGDEINGNASYA